MFWYFLRQFESLIIIINKFIIINVKFLIYLSKSWNSLRLFYHILRWYFLSPIFICALCVASIMQLRKIKGAIISSLRSIADCNELQLSRRIATWSLPYFTQKPHSILKSIPLWYGSLVIFERFTVKHRIFVRLCR